MNLDRAWAASRDAVRRHPVLADAVLALGLVAISIGMLLAGPDDRAAHRPGTSEVVGLTLAVLVVFARRRFTLAAFVASVAAANVFLVVDGRQQPILTATIALLLYTYVTHVDRRTGWLVAVAVAAVLVLAELRWSAADWDSLGTLAWIGMATAIADATRSRRAYVAEVEERARRAERSRDEQARLRVIQERMRIARELHDVVAHHIAVIKVQASGAKNVLPHSPDRVAAALDHISHSSDTALKEMASAVGLLRNSPDPGLLRNSQDPGLDSPQTRPASGLAQLPELLAGLAAGGLRVEHRQVGGARELPVRADLAAYRIAQEALTNAQRYGEGTAHLTVVYTPDAVSVRVTNSTGGEPARRGPGYGIVGMRERVAANGGSFQAGPSGDGGFAVLAVLPAPAEEAAR